MDRLTTTWSELGSATTNQQRHFASTYKQIKAAIASVLMWLSMVGGLL